MLRTAHAGDGWRVWPVSEPMPTQTARQELALCVPLVGKTCMHGSNGSCCAPANQPAPTQTTCQDSALVVPIIAPQNTGVYGQRPDQPGPTITTKGHQALIAPLLMNNTTHHRGGRADGPAPTITTGGQTGVVVPALAYLNHGAVQSGSVKDPLRTVVSGGGHAGLIAAFLTTYFGQGKNASRVTDPLRTCTTKDRHGLVCVTIAGDEYVIVDILFRMLRPRELAAAMGFPPEYVWPKAQRDAVRLIGNAVAVPQAEALIFATLPGMRPRRDAGRGAVARA